jgi:acyl-CoA synthetase (AMP-forming)/AMP-acid ligase II
VKPLAAPTIIHALFQRADGMPDATAFVVGDEALSYGGLGDGVVRIAAGLGACDVARGDRCALLLPTGFDFIQAFFGAQLHGAIPVPINPALATDSLLARLQLIRCSVVAGDAASLEPLRGHGHPFRLVTVDELRGARRGSREDFRLPDADHPAMLFLTSGTTGEPRAGVRLHRNLLASVTNRLNRLPVMTGDVFVGWIPLYHTMGLSHFVAGPLHAGCPAYLIQPSAANLDLWIETISSVRGTITSGPDFGYRAAAALSASRDVDLTSLRVATSGSEPVRLATIQRFEETFRVPGVIRPMYGLSEAGAVTMLGPGEALRSDQAGRVSCGRPLDGVTLQIVDDEGRVMPAGAAGEIRLRGDQVFPGYFEDEAATRQMVRDGWLYTGDTGAVDADGHLFVHGRMRSLIKRGGASIAPRELEAAAEAIDGVHLAAAVGVSRPNSLGTEDIVIIAEVDRGRLSPEERVDLTRAVADALRQARGLSPSDIVLVVPGAVPRTANGKIRHDELRRLYLEGALTG